MKLRGAERLSHLFTVSKLEGGRAMISSAWNNKGLSRGRGNGMMSPIQIFVEHLLCAGHTSRIWDHGSEGASAPASPGESMARANQDAVQS